MLRTVEADGNAISYTLERKPVKNINLRIRADQCVYVSAPKDVAAKMVDAFVVEKSAYILRALKKFKDKNRETVSENNFVNGETVKFLGRNLRLKIKNASRSKVESDESYVTYMLKTCKTPI
jgi:predicted metal-dependent hydrolase